jgi:hypothetical protein
MHDLIGRYAKLAKLLREALAARHDRLDDADLAELVERMQLSQQDVDGMLRWLSFDTARVRALNLTADKYLRALTPERIWTSDPPPPVPRAAVEMPDEDGGNGSGGPVSNP